MFASGSVRSKGWMQEKNGSPGGGLLFRQRLSRFRSKLWVGTVIEDRFDAQHKSNRNVVVLYSCLIFAIETLSGIMTVMFFGPSPDGWVLTLCPSVCFSILNSPP